MKENEMLDENLIQKYQIVFTDENNLKDYQSYYSAYVNFINENREFFDESILTKWGLNMLLSLDPCKYIASKPDLSLQMEFERLRKRVFENIDDLAMSIRDTLWDMITIYSGIDCPINKHDELRYIKIQHGDDSEELFLECTGCGLIMDIEGNQYNYNKATDRLFPTAKEEVEKFQHNKKK